MLITICTQQQQQGKNKPKIERADVSTFLDCSPWIVLRISCICIVFADRIFSFANNDSAAERFVASISTSLFLISTTLSLISTSLFLISTSLFLISTSLFLISTSLFLISTAKSLFFKWVVKRRFFSSLREILGCSIAF